MKKALALLLLFGVVVWQLYCFLYPPGNGQTAEDWADKYGQDDPALSPPAPEPKPVVPPPRPSTTRPPLPEPPQPGPIEEAERVEPPAGPVAPPPTERPLLLGAQSVRPTAPPPPDAVPIRQRARDAEGEFQRIYAELTAAQARSDDREKKTCCSTGNQ
jgi:hypothetical protein